MLELDFDATTGLLTSAKDVHTGNSLPITQNLYWYKAAVGDGSTSDKQASGAYIFRPNGTTPYPMTTSNVHIDRVTVRFKAYYSIKKLYGCITKYFLNTSAVRWSTVAKFYYWDT